MTKTNKVQNWSARGYKNMGHAISELGYNTDKQLKTLLARLVRKAKINGYCFIGREIYFK